MRGMFTVSWDTGATDRLWLVKRFPSGTVGIYMGWLGVLFSPRSSFNDWLNMAAKDGAQALDRQGEKA